MDCCEQKRKKKEEKNVGQRGGGEWDAGRNICRLGFPYGSVEERNKRTKEKEVGDRNTAVKGGREANPQKKTTQVLNTKRVMCEVVGGGDTYGGGAVKRRGTRKTLMEGGKRPAPKKQPAQEPPCTRKGGPDQGGTNKTGGWSDQAPWEKKSLKKIQPPKPRGGPMKRKKSKRVGGDRSKNTCHKIRLREKGD